jgi:hypothetical protein
MENKFTKYTFTQRYGMEGIGDMENEWLTYEEIEAKEIRTTAYIEECKAKGIYGQEYTTTIEIEDDPSLDIERKGGDLMSYSMVITDFSK